MNRYITNIREYGILLGCILISLILLFSKSTPQLEAIKAKTLKMAGVFHSLNNSLSRHAHVEKTNQFLREQNTRLALENSRMRAAVLENERLRKLIDFKTDYPSKLIAARIIGGSTTGVINYILLESGENDGIRRDMPIVLPDGLVGKIIRVSPTHSMGHMLFDQNFRVSAKVQRSSIKGIISWQGGQTCILNEVPNRSDVKPGDRVVTSGYSQIFPEGIYIGTVEKAENTKRSLSMIITVRPEIDFDRLEEVLIIADRQPSITNLDQ
ncbi:rod shape-determining protein MreC [candidate division KSB1 bacterium]|nr:rod shape-determining protein MreC [candidate division KSB1 bacterium]